MKKSKTRRLPHRSTDYREPKPRPPKLIFAVYFFIFVFLVGLGGIYVCDSMKRPDLINSLFGPLCFTALGLGFGIGVYLAIRNGAPIYGSFGVGILRFGSKKLTREDTPIRYWIWVAVFVFAGLGLTVFGVYLLATGGRLLQTGHL